MNAYDESEFPEDRRPVVGAINRLLEALATQRLPADEITAVSPDYATDEVVIYVSRASTQMERAVAEVLDAGTYRIEERPVFGGRSAVTPQ